MPLVAVTFSRPLLPVSGSPFSKLMMSTSWPVARSLSTGMRSSESSKPLVAMQAIFMRRKVGPGSKPSSRLEAGEALAAAFGGGEALAGGARRRQPAAALEAPPEDHGGHAGLGD